MAKANVVGDVMRRSASLALAGGLALAVLATPGKASAEAMLHVCNEASEPVSLAMRVFGLAWEKSTLTPGQCQKLRISGFNLLFNTATLGHGAKLRLQPLEGSEQAREGFCEWKIDFSSSSWEHHAIRLEDDGIHCVFNPSGPASAG